MSAASPLPPLIATWYGDDFSGSTDVMEAFTLNGLPAVLFLEPPAPADLAEFPGVRAVGVAGVARSKSPQWMEANLPPILERLGRLGAPLVQYKVCSTFDSSPEVGSIGRALDIGRRVLATQSFTPIVVGAPVLRRYVAFGNLFATVGPVTHRLDRHPTMSRHPVTPMNEADLVRHLARQSAARVASFDLLALGADDFAARFGITLADRPDAVLFDTLDARSLERAGALVWRHAARPTYCVASSGLQYALVAHFRAEGWLPEPARPDPPARADRIVVVSGSCSPATAAQIARAEEAGCATIRVDPRLLAAGNGSEIDRARNAGLAALSAGRSVVLYTARGPDDSAVTAFDAFVRERGMAREAANEGVGAALGALLRGLLLETGARRAVVCGGDTSGEAARALGLQALTMLSPLAPGSPLCRAHARERGLDGLEIALKGGQVGGPDYLLAAAGHV
jgi:uncharacterized protein YgbK (DUF1537 family)